MYHLDNVSGVPEMPEPKEQQSITPRWFGESQEQGGISWPGADWFNTVQAELLNLLAAAGLTPDKRSFDQLSHAIPVLGDAGFRDNLRAVEGLKWVGECADLDDLRNTEPTSNGQQIYLESRVSEWSVKTRKMPWGGGKFRYIEDLPPELQFDDNGSVIKTTGGKYWVRTELMTSVCPKVYVEWFLDTAPSLNSDASDALQAAFDAADVFSRYGSVGIRVKVVMPPYLCLTKETYMNPRTTSIDGNYGVCQVVPSVNYVSYSSLSTNSNITPTPDEGKIIRGVIILKSVNTPGTPGSVAYSDMEFVKKWTIYCGEAAEPTKPVQRSLTDDGLFLFLHYGDDKNGTVATAQFSMRNVNFLGFTGGYINGDYAWGGNFWECKWVGCWLPVMLINGQDNTERFNFFGCVMQNGFRCIYSPWGGDVKLIGGSYVHNTGPYWEIPKGSNIWDISPSRIEQVSSVHPLLIASTTIEDGSVSQTYPLFHIHDTQILIDAHSMQAIDNYLFGVGKYCSLKVDDNTWSNKNMANLIGKRMLDNADTGGAVFFSNNTCRVGVFSDMGRDLRLMTTKVPCGRVSRSGVTVSGNRADTASVVFNGPNLEITVNSTTNDGNLAFLIRLPIDVDMSQFASLSWRVRFSSLQLNAATAANWTMQAFVSSDGADYVSNRLDLGSVSLSDFLNSFDDVHSNNSWGWPKSVRRDEWDRIPTEVYLYIASGIARTQGDKLVLSRAGLLMY